MEVSLEIVCLVLALSAVLQISTAQTPDCNGATGTLPYPGDCHKYVYCVFGQSIVRNCPLGLNFDAKSKLCDFPAIARCAGGRGGSSSRSSGGRPHDSPSHYKSRPSYGDRRPSIVESVHVPKHKSSREDWDVYRVPDFQHQPRYYKSPEYEYESEVEYDKPQPSYQDTKQEKQKPKPNIQQYEKALCLTDGFFPDPSDCQRYVQCVAGRKYSLACPQGTHFVTKLHRCSFTANACELEEVQGGDGYIVSVKRENDDVKKSSSQPVPKGDLLSQVKAYLDTAFRQAKAKMVTMMSDENNKAKTLKGRPRSSAFKSVQSFLGSTKFVKQLSVSARLQLEALKIIKNRFNLGKQRMEEIMKQLSTVLKSKGQRVYGDMTNTMDGDMDSCPNPLNSEDNDCDARAAYRTYDGTCNNLRHPLWGRSFMSLPRNLPADYADGIEEPRASSAGYALPSPRKVSWNMFKDTEKESSVHTMFVMSFGQFLDHDCSRTAVSKLSTDANGGGEMVDVMCGDSGCETEGTENTACLPISVKDDPIFQHKQCLMFVRSQEILPDDCRLGPREQLNQLTSYLDMSHVYGSTKDESDYLRDTSDPRRGKLKGSHNPLSPNSKDMLPTKEDPLCKDTTSQIKCFTAGDKRVNEQVALTAIHTLWHRLHNQYEDKLHGVNPHWGGERLFQETRRLLGATWQHMVYNEYLPLVLGPDQVARFGLKLAASGYYDVYDPSVNPGVSNAFATAAFRWGHSTIGQYIRFMDQTFSKQENVTLSNVFRRPYEVYNTARPGGTGVDGLILGSITQYLQDTDSSFTKEVTTKLFTENPKDPNALGTDLLSLNLQRGREHGLPSYAAWREWCGFGKPHSFDSLRHVMPQSDLENLKKVYKDVKDIDLFAGGMCETKVKGGLVGPTFACIIGRQFRALRTGDRFWYERQDPVTKFKPDQLEEIRKITISRVICDTLDYCEDIQKYVFLHPISEAFKKLGRKSYQDVYSLASLYRGENNERRPCSTLPSIDFSKWKDH